MKSEIYEPGFVVLATNMARHGKKMRLLWLVLLVFGFAPFSIPSRAQVPSAAPPDPGQADSVPQHRHDDTPDEAQSARSFKGTIVRAGAQLLLREKTAHTLYKLDDQKKAKEYEGKRVTVTATMDSNSNTLRVIDIVPSTRRAQATAKQ